MLPQNSANDLAAHAILSRWCRTEDTELALKRLAVLERVSLLLRSKLPATLRNSSQLLAHRLATQGQEMERKMERAKKVRAGEHLCMNSQKPHEPSEPTPSS